jgi:hypothetical protein
LLLTVGCQQLAINLSSDPVIGNAVDTRQPRAQNRTDASEPLAGPVLETPVESTNAYDNQFVEQATGGGG